MMLCPNGHENMSTTNIAASAESRLSSHLPGQPLAEWRKRSNSLPMHRTGGKRR